MKTHHRLILSSPLPYPIYLGTDLLKHSGELLIPYIGGQVLLVSDQQIAPHYRAPLCTSLKNAQPDLIIEHIVLPPGEHTKSLDYFAQIVHALAEMKATRDCTLIALGGGVIGDLAGFAAASWMRGVNYIQVPTTLLAMVDSSIGGKTAIDLAQGKNLVGAFHSPKAVLMDVTTLQTLAQDQFCSGFAEVIKYAAICDRHFFQWLLTHSHSLRAKKTEALVMAIRSSCEHKAALVSADFYEKGKRALLNFGHTFGHAIETVYADAPTRQYAISHGQAVAYGMVLAARLSTQLGLAPPEDVHVLCHLLEAYGLASKPVTPLPAAEIFACMRLDKKNRHHQLRLVLWRGIGRAEIVENVNPAQVMRVLQNELIAHQPTQTPG